MNSWLMMSYETYVLHANNSDVGVGLWHSTAGRTLLFDWRTIPGLCRDVQLARVRPLRIG